MRFHAIRYFAMTSFYWLARLTAPCMAASGVEHLHVEALSLESSRETTTGNVPLDIDIMQAQVIALERHPSLTVARAAIVRARADLKEAGFFPNPWLTVEGEEVPRNWDVGGGLVMSSINASLITGGKRGFRIRAARTGVDRAALLYEQQALEVLQNARRAFYEVLAAAKKIEVSQELARVTADFHARVTIRVDEGEARPLEADRTLVLAAQAEFDVRRARADLEISRQNLAQALGLPGDRLGKVSGALEPAGTLASIEVLQERARRLAPSLRVPRLEEEIGFHQLKLARAQRVPDIEVGLSAQHQRNEDSAHDFRGFNVSVPLQVFNHGQAARLRAKADISEARGKKVSARQDLETRLVQAYQDSIRASDQIDLYQDRILPAARRAVSRTREGYEAGEFSYLDVLDAQRSLVGVNQTYVESLLDYQRARADLSAAVAGDVEEVTSPSVARESIELTEDREEHHTTKLHKGRRGGTR